MRGPPRTACRSRPQWASHRAGMRTRTSAHLARSASARCADLPVRNWASHRAGMRTRTSAHLAVFGGGAVRGPPGPQLGLAPGRNADEDVRAPRGVRRLRGARTSRSAIAPCAGPECGRGRPRTSQCSASAGCADVPVRILWGDPALCALGEGVRPRAHEGADAGVVRLLRILVGVERLADHARKLRVLLE